MGGGYRGRKGQDRNWYVRSLGAGRRVAMMLGMISRLPLLLLHVDLSSVWSRLRHLRMCLATMQVC